MFARPHLASTKDRAAVFSPTNHCMRLVDFGQAIDMSLYPAGTTFMAKVGTSGFQCIQMMTDQPWTYQVKELTTVLYQPTVTLPAFLIFALVYR